MPHFKREHNYESGRLEKWKCAICVDKTMLARKMEVHYQRFHQKIYAKFSSTTLNKTSNEEVETKDKSKTKAKRRILKKEKINDTMSENYFPCNFCGNSFKSTYRYHKHLNDIHGVTEHEILPENSEEILNIENSAGLSHNLVLKSNLKLIKYVFKQFK
jgi:uncharacterized C2H2 Zn-finger protein